MGRKAKEKTTANSEDGSMIGHNSIAELTDLERKALLIDNVKSYEKLLAVKKEADAAFKNGCKRAKAELGPDAVDEIKDFILLRSPEGEKAFKARVERQMRIARYSGTAPNTQFDMFASDSAPADERAREEGRQAGMEGEFMSANPYDPSLPQFSAWNEGWHEGQKAIFAIGEMRKVAAEKTVGEDDEDEDQTDLKDVKEGEVVKFPATPDQPSGDGAPAQ